MGTSAGRERRDQHALVVRPGDAADELGAFFDAAFDDVHRYLARRCVGDAMVAEDLTQETFVTAIQSLRSGAIEHLSIGWLMTCARSRLIDHYRREATRSRHLRAIGSDALAGDFTEEVVADDAVAALLDHLPAGQRLDVALHHLDGLPVSEIAERTSRSERAVESSLARARRALRTISTREAP